MRISDWSSDVCSSDLPFPFFFTAPESQMFFRNLTFFRFPTSLDLSELETQLANCALKPVGALELSSRGFISPFGRDDEALSHRIGDALWLSVGSEDKLLPSEHGTASWRERGGPSVE